MVDLGEGLIDRACRPLLSAMLETKKHTEKKIITE